MKKIRLPLEIYATTNAWHITIRARADTVPFWETYWAASTIEQLKASGERTGIRVLVYCLMPDHLHLLIDNPDGADVIKFVRHFKQMTGYSYKRATETQLW